jgi:hypothetical protein
MIGPVCCLGRQYKIPDFPPVRPDLTPTRITGRAQDQVESDGERTSSIDLGSALWAARVSRRPWRWIAESKDGRTARHVRDSQARRRDRRTGFEARGRMLGADRSDVANFLAPHAGRNARSPCVGGASRARSSWSPRKPTRSMSGRRSPRTIWRARRASSVSRSALPISGASAESRCARAVRWSRSIRSRGPWPTWQARGSTTARWSGRQGGSARRLECEGAALAGIHTIRTRADVDLLRSELPDVERVAVVGGGGALRARQANRRAGGARSRACPRGGGAAVALL